MAKKSFREAWGGTIGPKDPFEVAINETLL